MNTMNEVLTNIGHNFGNLRVSKIEIIKIEFNGKYSLELISLNWQTRSEKFL